MLCYMKCNESTRNMRAITCAWSHLRPASDRRIMSLTKVDDFSRLSWRYSGHESIKPLKSDLRSCENMCNPPILYRKLFSKLEFIDQYNSIRRRWMIISIHIISNEWIWVWFAKSKFHWGWGSERMLPLSSIYLFRIVCKYIHKWMWYGTQFIFKYIVPSTKYAHSHSERHTSSHPIIT